METRVQLGIIAGRLEEETGCDARLSLVDEASVPSGTDVMFCLQLPASLFSRIRAGEQISLVVQPAEQRA